MKDEEAPKNDGHTEYATELKKRLTRAFKEGDLVMWMDKKPEMEGV